MNEVRTMLNHETEPHCCGCWTIQYGDNAVYALNAVCNECGKVVDLMPALTPPTDAKIREAVAYLSTGWGEGTEACIFKRHVDTLLRSVQPPRLAEFKGGDMGSALGELKDWQLDNSAGRPVLTYQGCSVFEEDQAHAVLALVKAALTPPPGELAELRDKQNARAEALETVVRNADKLHREIAEALGRKDMPNDLLVRTANSLRAANAALTEENAKLKATQDAADAAFFCGHCGAKFLRTDEGYKEGVKHEQSCQKNPLVRKIAALTERVGLLLGGVAMIAAERQRQKSEEGWSPEHDEQHVSGELARAAAAYCLPSLDAHLYFPCSWQNKREGFPMPTMRDLVKAGALIAAEIDRRTAANAATSVEAAS